MIGPDHFHGTALADGRLHLWGIGAALCRWFDNAVLAMALADGAVECRFPATLDRDTLVRAGYFDAFPAGANTVAPADDGVAYALCPAVCYHAYEWFRGVKIDRPVTLTAAQTCFRRADRAGAAPTRLWEFTMREIIFLGPPEWVVDQRRVWEARAAAVATRTGLEGALEPATDLFFGDAARGQRLIQQLKSLKTEWRMAAGDERIAAASFNLHETFFSSRFAFGMADGSAAHSSCAAFGLERWALALLAQRGADAAAALVSED